MRFLLTLTCALTLTACASSRPSVKIDAKPVAELKLAAAQPDPALQMACRDPVELKGYLGLSGKQVRQLWAQDRDALADCRDRKAGEQRFYADRDAALAGGK